MASVQISIDGIYLGSGPVDNDPPVIQNHSPSPAGKIDPNGIVSFEIYDTSSGVNLSTVSVEFDTGTGYTTAYESSTFQIGCDGTATSSQSGNLYSFEINPDASFGTNKTIYIRITASDNSGNSDTTIYYLRTQRKYYKRNIKRIPSIKLDRGINAKELFNTFIRNTKE